MELPKNGAQESCFWFGLALGFTFLMWIYLLYNLLWHFTLYRIATQIINFNSTVLTSWGKPPFSDMLPPPPSHHRPAAAVTHTLPQQGESGCVEHHGKCEEVRFRGWVEAVVVVAECERESIWNTLCWHRWFKPCYINNRLSNFNKRALLR